MLQLSAAALAGSFCSKSSLLLQLSAATLYYCPVPLVPYPDPRKEGYGMLNLKTYDTLKTIKESRLYNNEQRWVSPAEQVMLKARMLKKKKNSILTLLDTDTYMFRKLLML